MKRFLSLLILLYFSYTTSSYAASLLIVGDSLSAGYNMPVERSWPVLLPPLLRQQGHDIDVINASISGDTTGNGLKRLPALLSQHQPDYVLVELGANDGLRGFSPALIRKNLQQMIEHSQAIDAKVMLMQIHVPPNYGKRYSQAFSQIFSELSQQNNISLLPFFLEQVITKPHWMMKDGLHPNAEAQPWIAAFMAEQILPQLIK